MINKIIFYILLTLSILSPSLLYADGGVYQYDLYDKSTLVDETEQNCYINYRNGTQKMILEVNAKTNTKAKSIIWLFPIPALPQDIKLDILDKTPLIYGGLLNGHYLMYYDNIIRTFYATQFFRPMFNITYIIDTGLSNKSDPGVLLFDKVEKLGMTTFVLSAKNDDALEKFMAERKLQFPIEFKKIIRDYIYKDYSFVVSYVSNQKTIDKTYHKLAIYITFLTPKIFFPLKPTSIYNSSVIPINIYVIGYVMPKLFDSIRPFTKYSYKFDDSYESNEKFDDFFFNQSVENNLRFTNIRIKAESNKLTDDLWMNTNATKPNVLQFLIDHRYIFGYIFFLIISCMSSLLSGFIIFSKNKIKPLKFLIFGACNTFSLLGLIIMAYVHRIDTKFTDIKTNEKATFPYKKHILPVFIISLIVLYFSASCYQAFRIYILDPGESTHSFFITILLYSHILTYTIMFIAYFITFGALSYIYYNSKMIIAYSLSFTIIFHLLTYLLGLLFNDFIDML